MIEAISDVFVERVPRVAARRALVPAASLLVVDACGKPRRITDLTRLVEGTSPLRASYITLECVDEVPELATYEMVWLFVDSASDLNYCGLYLRELSDRFRGARIEMVGVGEVASDECSLLLSDAMVGVAPPWRRGRELARGAKTLMDGLVR